MHVLHRLGIIGFVANYVLPEAAPPRVRWERIWMIAPAEQIVGRMPDKITRQPKLGDLHTFS